MELKLVCPCGQKFKFDVEPVHGRMPFAINCPACGADGTQIANRLLSQLLPPASAAPIPVAASAAPIPVATLVAPAPVVTQAAPAPVPIPAAAPAAPAPALAPPPAGLRPDRTNAPPPVAAMAAPAPVTAPKPLPAPAPVPIVAPRPAAAPAMSGSLFQIAPPPAPLPIPTAEAAAPSPIAAPTPAALPNDPPTGPKPSNNSFLLGTVGALLGAAAAEGVMVGTHVYLRLDYQLFGVVMGAIIGLGARLLYRGADLGLGLMAAAVTLVTISGTLFFMFGFFELTFSILAVLIGAGIAFKIAFG